MAFWSLQLNAPECSKNLFQLVISLNRPFHDVCYVPLSWFRPPATLWKSDVHSVLSSEPCSAPMASFTESICLLVCVRLFLLPSLFAALLSLPKNPAFSTCAQRGTASVPSFFPPAMCQASIRHSGCQGIHRSLLLHHTSNESICFLSAFVTVHISHSCIGTATSAPRASEWTFCVSLISSMAMALLNVTTQ